MLVAALRAYHAMAPRRPVLIAGGQSWSAHRILALAAAQSQVLRGRGAEHLGTVMRESPELVALLAATSDNGQDLTLLDPEQPPLELHATVARLGIDTVVGSATTPHHAAAALAGRYLALPCSPGETSGGLRGTPARAGSIGVLTSGTTGEPRSVMHSWSGLASRVRQGARCEGQRWLLAYRLKHFAGLQVLLHTMLSRSTLVIADSSHVSAMWAAARREEVTHISATPTFWRMVAAAAEPALPLLKHITLGGEAITESVLGYLATHYPQATVSQVYATTELGSIVSVRDRRPGLPAQLFDDRPEHPARFRIVDSELQVRRADGFVSTGDLVVRSGDRVHFLGRTAELINVGGVKVHPHSVEAAVDGLEGVALSRAGADPNPITGQLVRLDVVLCAGARIDEVERRIHEACRLLGRHARPARIRYLETLEMNNFKLQRRA